MQTPIVSVIMPVFNVEEYVAQAITSVLDQSFKNFELLIIDDGSTDSSIDICRVFEDRRIRIFKQKNRGLAGARNSGIRNAKGRYLAFLDSDDLWHPRKLANHVAHLNACSKIGVSYAASELINENGASIGIIQSPKIAEVNTEDIFLRNPIGNGSAPVIRKQVFAEIKFQGPNGYSEWFDETFRQSEDIECWIRIALTTNWNFGGINDVLTYYRVNKGGLSANIVKQYESWERVAAKVKHLDLEFYEKWYRLSRSFQLRYLARRAARMRDGKTALALAARAIFGEFRILIHEPKKTCETFFAAFLLRALPIKAYEKIEASILANGASVNA